MAGGIEGVGVPDGGRSPHAASRRTRPVNKSVVDRRAFAMGGMRRIIQGSFRGFSAC